MDKASLLKEFVKKEQELGCYACRVAGVNVYPLIQNRVRRHYLKNNEQELMPLNFPIQVKKAIVSFLISCWHMMKVLIKHRHVDSIIFPFHRIEKIDELYVDKFTDPVIEFSLLKDSCLIFERSWAGAHRTPRMHGEITVYTDVFDVLSKVYSILFYSFFRKKHKQELNGLFELMNGLVPFSVADFKWYVQKIMRDRALSYFYTKVYKQLSPKQIVVIPKMSFLPQLYAAKKMNIKTIEFQHGITYSETVTYSGYRDPMITPDYFFAFGDTPPRNVYGIDEDRIVNIGWAFPRLIDQLNTLPKLSEMDILVISDPEITDKIIDIVGELAMANPSYRFHIRPHPMEVLSDMHVATIRHFKNVVVSDNRINSNVVLNAFTHIIGENSTVLYEALAAKKKVGKLCYPAFHPLYLNPEDRHAVWEISSQRDFEKYVSENVSTRRSMSIYSEFDSEIISEILSDR